MKRFMKTKLFTWLALVCILVAGISVPSSAASSHQIEAQVIESSETNAPFEMTMLDVGQGLSLLIKADGKYMIYDGGGRSRSSYVVSYLKKHGVTELQYLTASHYDEDHIAGLVGVLNTTKVDTIVCPDYQKDTKIYQSFINKEQQSKAKVIHPKTGYTLTLGNAAIKVLSADNSAEKDNNRSIAMRVTYGNFSVIMTGDAELDEETSIIYNKYNIDSDVYVAGHHGSKYSSSTAFLNAVTPAYTLISCGTGNSYGHPTEEALRRIKESGSKLYRTDVQGEVTVYSDGNKYWFSQAPSNNWTQGDIVEKSETKSNEGTTGATISTSDDASGTTYILNTRSKKFHYPYCNSVSKMSEKNKKSSHESREQLIKQGYQPCKNCNP